MTSSKPTDVPTNLVILLSQPVYKIKIIHGGPPRAKRPAVMPMAQLTKIRLYLEKQNYFFNCKRKKMTNQKKLKIKV